jgi:nucleoredoxin
MPAQPNWTWRTISGEVYTNVKVLSVDRDSVMIMYDGGGQRVPLAYLPSDLQKLFNYSPSADVGSAISGGSPAAGGTSAGPPSVVASMVSGNLVRYTGNGLQPVPDSTLAPARYIAVYYSAQWCPPCHAFTPQLVQFYNSFKPTHPDFDLIFVSEDHDENQMQDYMKEMAMPWPAVRYDQLAHPAGSFKGTGIEGFANDGIPDLVLLDSTGKVLSDSFHGSEYVGPQAVVADIQSMVKN